MKIVRITLLGCPSCIIMNNRFNKIKDNYEFELEDYDLDIDSLEKYNPGTIMPVYIFMKDDKEVTRLVGEHSAEELAKIMEELK